jgi:hypothetical protein
MDSLLQAIQRCAEYGGPPMTFRIGAAADIRLDDRRDGSHLLAGATIAWFPESSR